MKSKSREDDSRPFQGQRIRLNPDEALRAVQLEMLVEKQRETVMSYLLLRASFLPVGVEKRAWYILLLLLNFVEKFHYFPHNKELNEFLHSAFGSEEKMPKLPSLQKVDLISRREILSDTARILRKEEPDE